MVGSGQVRRRSSRRCWGARLVGPTDGGRRGVGLARRRRVDWRRSRTRPGLRGRWGSRSASRGVRAGSHDRGRVIRDLAVMLADARCPPPRWPVAAGDRGDRRGRAGCAGLWWHEAEGAKFWLAMLNDLHHRGVEDVLICYADGRTGPRGDRGRRPAGMGQRCIVRARLVRLTPQVGRFISPRESSRDQLEPLAFESGPAEILRLFTSALTETRKPNWSAGVGQESRGRRVRPSPTQSTYDKRT